MTSPVPTPPVLFTPHDLHALLRNVHASVRAHKPGDIASSALGELAHFVRDAAEGAQIFQQRFSFLPETDTAPLAVFHALKDHGAAVFGEDFLPQLQALNALMQPIALAKQHPLPAVSAEQIDAIQAFVDPLFAHLLPHIGDAP